MITMHDIIRDGNPTLRARAQELTFPLSDEEKELAHQMMEFLENSQDISFIKTISKSCGICSSGSPVG